ncbi:MAG: flavodoxin family protein [Ignavibacteriaceae bacterium]
MTLNKMQEDLCNSNDYDFTGLSALMLNCTLKKSPTLSHTEGLLNVSKEIMEKKGVKVEMLRPIDFNIAHGVYPDMTEHGWDKDDWPVIYKKVQAVNILILGSPIWLGEKSSICTQIIERLYTNSGELNADGQYAFYGKVGGCIITGNEDGIKHCSMNILYSLQHVGYLIPPQADAGWIGEAGPGPSYLDKDSGGPQNEFTQRNTTFMTWNLMHIAKMLIVNNGIPAHGNQRSKWDAGCRFDSPNPEYR